MIQIVGLFLVGMVVLAVLGRMRKPGGRGGKSIGKPGARGKCRKCGRHLIGKAPCPCGGGSRKG